MINLKKESCIENHRTERNVDSPSHGGPRSNKSPGGMAGNENVVDITNLCLE